MEEKKLKTELTEEETAKVTGGTRPTQEFDEQMLARGGKSYAKDLLDNVPPGSSAIVLFDE